MSSFRKDWEDVDPRTPSWNRIVDEARAGVHVDVSQQLRAEGLRVQHVLPNAQGASGNAVTRGHSLAGRCRAACNSPSRLVRLSRAGAKKHCSLPVTFPLCSSRHPLRLTRLTQHAHTAYEPVHTQPSTRAHSRVGKARRRGLILAAVAAYSSGRVAFRRRRNERRRREQSIRMITSVTLRDMKRNCRGDHPGGETKTGAGEERRGRRG